MSDYYDALKSPAERLYEHLAGMRTEDLEGLFIEEPNINEPIDGPVTGADAINKMMKASKLWPNIKEVEPLVRIHRVERAMFEVLAQVQVGDKVNPVFITTYADLDDGKISRGRIYYNSNLIGLQINRGPIIHSDPTICFPRDYVGAYHKALHAGNLEEVLANFETGGYFKGPSGNYYRGLEELRKMFGYYFLEGDGIMLRYTTLTDDGMNLAIEYNYECWGKTLFPTECGCAIYERSPSGKILRGRSCDTVFVPVEVPQPLPDDPAEWGPLAESSEFTKK